MQNKNQKEAMTNIIYEVRGVKNSLWGLSDGAVALAGCSLGPQLVLGVEDAQVPIGGSHLRGRGLLGKGQDLGVLATFEQGLR